MKFGTTGTSLVFCALLLASAAEASDDAQARAQSAEFDRKMREAYRQKDWPAFLENAQKAEQLLPGTPRLVYNLASAHARLGHVEEASKLLENLLARGLHFEIEDDPNFAGVITTPQFQALARHAAALETPVGSSEVAFRLSERDLLTEGIAWDPQTRSFFISSVHRRKILRRSADGAVSDFIKSAQDGIDGVLALRVDPSRRILWACSVALPQEAGLEAGREGASGVFGYDIDKGTLVGKYELPKDGKAHALNDLTIGPRGEVYSTDSLASGVYVLMPGRKALEEYIAPGVFRSPQGLAFSEDGKRLVIADWSEGLWSVDLATRKREPVSVPAGVELIGIDGLAARGDELFVVQNLVRPHRVARLKLDAAGTRVLKGEILDAADPEFSEPTLDVVAGDALYVIAKSQWSLFDEKGGVATEKLQEPTILKIRLDQKGSAGVGSAFSR
jgi:sugar lactone lactonase YvrE